MRNSLRSGMLMLMAVALLMVLGACAANGDENNTTGAQNNEENQSNNENKGGEELSGDVKTAGSSTVYPMQLALAEWYREVQPNVNVTVDSIGSGGGFDQSTQGLIDFSNASRPIKDSEVEAAKGNDIQLEPIVLAYDGLTVAVSAENDFVDELSVDQLKEIFLSESGNTKWSDINPDWPNETINIFAPGHDSGTFDYFNEVILEDKPMREDENTTLSEDDNILVRGISNDPNAIGFFGYAYYIQNEGILKALKINGVEPNLDTIQSGEYSPLSRPLFTYVNVNALEKPQVYDYAMFVIENAGKSAEEVGYVPLSKEEYDEQKASIAELAGN